MAKDEDKVWAFIGVAVPILGYIILLLAKKGGAYAMYYGKQGLVLGIAGIILWVISMILGRIPVIGWIIHTILWLIWVVLWIFGIVYAFSGQQKNLPLVGDFAKKF